jgi:hypothetical protein
MNHSDEAAKRSFEMEERWKRSNTQNANGVEGKSPSENATSFSDLYCKLFDNGGEGDQAKEWCSKMPRTPQNRERLQLQMWEMEAAIK